MRTVIGIRCAWSADLESCAEEILNRLVGMYFSGGGDVRRKNCS